jgi:hypothetical protein
MKLQDIENNKEEIISIITEECGESKVDELIEIMKRGLDCCDDLDDLITSAIAIFGYDEPRRKVSKNAKILGRLEQIEIENN